MKIEKGKHYFLKIIYLGRELDYEGEVIYLDDKEFRIKTEDDDSLRFNLKDLIFAKEIRRKVFNENKVFVVRKKIGKYGLKRVEKPEGL